MLPLPGTVMPSLTRLERMLEINGRMVDQSELLEVKRERNIVNFLQRKGAGRFDCLGIKNIESSVAIATYNHLCPSVRTYVRTCVCDQNLNRHQLSSIIISRSSVVHQSFFSRSSVVHQSFINFHQSTLFIFSSTYCDF